MSEHTKVKRRKREPRVLNPPYSNAKVVVFSKNVESDVDEEASALTLIPKIYAIASDYLDDPELLIYKLKVPLTLSPGEVRALVKPLSAYVLPSLADALKSNIVASVFYNKNMKNWRLFTIVTVVNPEETFKLLTISISNSDDKLTKDEVIKIVKREKTEAKKFIYDALKTLNAPLSKIQVKESLFIRIAKSFTSEELKIEVEDGADYTSMTLKLREPEWSLTQFPDQLAEEIRTLIVEPLKEDREYAARGIILSGPPGMGKSVLVEAIANELNKKVIDLEPSTYRSMWYGHTEKIVRAIFNTLKRRNDVVVLIDDAEFLMNRGSAVNEAYVSEVSTFLKLLQERDRPLIAMTANYPEMIDPALLRPGRIDVLIVLGYPDKHFRRKIIETALNKYGAKAPESVIEEAVRLTRWFSSAEIDAMIRTALMKGKGTVSEEVLRWARKRFNINETERARIQERMLWYLSKIQGIVISYVKRPEEI